MNGIRLAVACLGASLLAGAASLCGAGTFHVAPVRVDVAAGARAGTLTIRNDSPDEPVVIQARSLRWMQQDGRDVTEATDELLVNPPIFTIKPGGQQLVRVGLRNPDRATEAKDEVSYRVLLAEVPQAAPADFRGIRVALNMTIPVFFAPQRKPEGTRPQVTLERKTDGQLIANVSNKDTRRYHVTEVSLSEPLAAKPVVTTNEARYVLTGSSVSWILRDAPALPSGSTLRLMTDRGGFAFSVGESNGQITVGAPTPNDDESRRR